jgi:hypothetical protein
MKIVGEAVTIAANVLAQNLKGIAIALTGSCEHYFDFLNLKLRFEELPISRLREEFWKALYLAPHKAARRRGLLLFRRFGSVF